jgi:hypothetical protein
MTKTLSSHAAAAAAIRAELKALFPDTKFSVTSESFSMGNAVRVHWTDGPGVQVIEFVIGKYQYGHFDVMTDYYEYSNHRDDIPQAKYVTTERRRSIEAMRALAAEVGKEWGKEIVINETRYGGWQVGDGLGADVRDIEDLLYRELRDRGEEELRAFEARAKVARRDSLDLGAGQALECKEFFSAAEERGLSALADYYEGEARS